MPRDWVTFISESHTVTCLQPQPSTTLAEYLRGFSCPGKGTQKVQPTWSWGRALKPGTSGQPISCPQAGIPGQIPPTSPQTLEPCSDPRKPTARGSRLGTSCPGCSSGAEGLLVWSVVSLNPAVLLLIKVPGSGSSPHVA